MPNKAGKSGHQAERIIRRNLVEAGTVDCVIALPAHLFTGAAVPVSVWLLRHPADPCETTLFLDARHLGAKSGSRRALGPQDVESLPDAYRAHRKRGSDGSVPEVFPQHLRDRRISDEVNELVMEETARRLRNFELRYEDIVCVRSGAIVPSALVREREAGWLMSPNVIRLRVPQAQRGKVLPEYLFHYLCLDETVEWMRDRAAATAAPSLRSASLGILKIPLPGLAEQQEIAMALSGVDELDRAHRGVAASLRHARIALAEDLLRPAAVVAPGLTAHRPSEKGALL